MSAGRDLRFVLLVGILLLILITLPYLFATWTSGGDYVFGSFLLNPLDGNSYLAKMYQGWQGDWRFKLPYTSEPGEGAYLFLLYIFLGHVARLIHLPLGVVFHVSRIMGAALLFWNLRCFWYEIYSDNHSRRLALLLSVFGSGMGWLAIPFGTFTADFWVAETYPFLSSYANPHFPLGLAIVLWLINPNQKRIIPKTKIYLWMVIACAFVLSVINPFGIVLVLMVLGGDQVWDWIIKKIENPSKSKFVASLDKRIIWIAIAGCPVVLYDFWIANSDPIFAGWNEQNLTPSPALWDLILSLSPALVLAIVGMWVYFSSKKQNRQLESLNIRLLVVWLGLGILLLYLPFSLQRRFMMGLYVPAVGLAILGLKRIKTWKSNWYRLLVTAVFVFALPTNLVIFMTGFYGAQSLEPQLYLSASESQAFEWIRANTPRDSLVLASPESGLFIPAYTGQRVIYGHPFETVNADSEEEAVTKYFSGNLSDDQVEIFLKDREIDYIFYGSREKMLGILPITGDLVPVYSSKDVTIYQVTH